MRIFLVASSALVRSSIQAQQVKAIGQPALPAAGDLAKTSRNHHHASWAALRAIPRRAPGAKARAEEMAAKRRAAINAVILRILSVRRAGASRLLPGDRGSSRPPFLVIIQRPRYDEVDRRPLGTWPFRQRKALPPWPADRRKEGDRGSHHNNGEQCLLVDEPGSEEAINANPDYSNAGRNEKAKRRSIMAPRRLGTEAPKRFHIAPPRDSIRSLAKDVTRGQYIAHLLAQRQSAQQHQARKRILLAFG